MKTLPKRSEVAVNDQWNLLPMYANLESWEADYTAVETQLPALGQHRGKLGDSVESLHSAITHYTATLRSLEKVYTYSHLNHDTDVGDSQWAAPYDRAVNLYSRFAAATSYLQPELLSIPSDVLDPMLESESLKPFARMIREITRYREHTLSEPEESLLAQGSEVFGNAERVFGQLNNADLDFGSIETESGTIQLSHASYSLLLRHSDRKLREAAYNQYMAEFAAHKNTLAATLSGNIKKKVFLSRVRKFPSALESSLFADSVPKSVFTGLIDTVSNALPELHRYLRVRKEILHIENIRPFDNYVPLSSDVHLKTTFDEACELVADACAPLGEEYVTILREGLTKKGWVDKYENQGKRSGAYASGCYDSAPYILMNYQENVLDHVFTLAHEAGHAMHSYLSNQHQSFQDHQYTIFVAEVASVLNEQLLLNEMKKRYAHDPLVTRYLLDYQLEGAFGTFFVQTMYSEFELKIHTLAEQNEALTTDRFVELYAEILKKYFGPDYHSEPIDGVSAFRIPHFYYEFYDYKYATGYASATALARRILAGDSEATMLFLKFLQSGGTKPPLELLLDAGVDLMTPTPVNETISTFRELTTQLETAFS